MNNWPILLTAMGIVITLVLGLYAITERNTSRLVDAFDKRMTERDAALLARLDALEAKLTGKIETSETRLSGRLDLLDAKLERELRAELNHLANRVEQLERRAA